MSVLSICPFDQAPIRRCVDLTPGLEVVFRQSSAETNPAEVNSAVENLYVVCPAAVFGSEQSNVNLRNFITKAMLKHDLVFRKTWPVIRVSLVLF